MKGNLSVTLLVASCFVGVLTVLSSLAWMIGLSISSDTNQELHEQAGIYLICFLYFIAPALGLISLVLGNFAWVQFARGRQARDLWSLCLGVGSMVVLGVQEAFWLWFAR